MRTFGRIRSRDEAIQELQTIGWILRNHQTGGDFEDFVRVEPERKMELLLVDFGLGKFLYSKSIAHQKIWSHNDEVDGDIDFDEILEALYSDEITLPQRDFSLLSQNEKANHPPTEVEVQKLLDEVPLFHGQQVAQGLIKQTSSAQSSGSSAGIIKSGESLGRI